MTKYHGGKGNTLGEGSVVFQTEFIGRSKIIYPEGTLIHVEGGANAAMVFIERPSTGEKNIREIGKGLDSGKSGGKKNFYKSLVSALEH